ncbi:MAG: phosphoribosylaminoimidazolesuccinocarboxamide synthase [Bacteroidetes bacterium]|nr:phosphoribosylaminoimidazolesuccinocarboxamide synthase [Bacteroidota bacterium]
MTLSIKETNFKFKGQTHVYKGKVRDVYFFPDKIVAVVSDRISAFDHILPRPIPYKGQILNQIAAKFLMETQKMVPNWLESCPDPNVSIGKRCSPIPIEMVIRGYLTGHAWREYKAGKRLLCGVPLPEGLKENNQLPQPIITPSTKAEEGHDEDISREEILSRGIVNEEDYSFMERNTRALYQYGVEYAKCRGLILVDTKYEFGRYGSEILLIDEIHTPDSSRYFYLEGYQERQALGEPQKQLSKEFVRQWLISQGFQGLQGQSMPKMDDVVVNSISERYIELFEKVTGQKFHKTNNGSIMERIEHHIRSSID